MKTKLAVRIERAMKTDESISDFMGRVMLALEEGFETFGAEEKYDLWPEEVYQDSIIVFNGRTKTYLRAALTEGEGGKLSFGEPVAVKAVWTPVAAVPPAPAEAPVEEGVARAAAPSPAPVQYATVDRPGVWSGIL